MFDARLAPRRAKRTENGATIVEAALFAPLLMLLLFGVINGGILFADHLSTSWATRSAARAATVAGADALADFDALAAVESGTVVFPKGNVERIVVFHARDYDDLPSEACKSGVAVSSTGPGACNVYTPADFDRPPTEFGIGGWTADDYWPGGLRENRLAVGSDYVGVWVRAHCSCFPAVFGSDGVLESTTVMRIEAKRV